MNILITLAGRSRRFHQAGYKDMKGLILIDQEPMIAHVIKMFPFDVKFHFVVNEQQLKDHPQLRDVLSSLAQIGSLTIIPPNDIGPVYSALQVKSIPDEEEVLISYSDFIVDWDYALFLRHAHGYDGAIPVFRGFHPASFGDTQYAYLRCDGEKMLELREKQCFTSDRSQEYASVGLYYFGSWGLYRIYAERFLVSGDNTLPEAYISQLYNPMVSDGLDVVVHEVDRFICWGTPKDLERYKFWQSYFLEETKNRKVSARSVNRTNLIPMAGKGSRFKQEEYRLSKSLIMVRGQPMMVRAADSFPDADEWIFLARSVDLKRHPIEATLSKFLSNFHLIPVNFETSGQAATCLLAEEQLEDDSELFIASCDYEVRYDLEKWEEIVEDDSVDGVIWTYRLESALVKDYTAFAYCTLKGDENSVEQVVEKRAISPTPASDPMVTGCFWFRRASDFLKAAKTMINKGITVGGEHYVGTSINVLLKDGARFVIFDVDKWVSFGDPFELSVLEYWEEHFFRRENRGRKFGV